MIKKPAIPTVPTGGDGSRRRFDSAIKERLEIMGGERSEKLEPLPLDSTLEQTCARLNKLLELLQ